MKREIRRKYQTVCRVCGGNGIDPRTSGWSTIIPRCPACENGIVWTEEVEITEDTDKERQEENIHLYEVGTAEERVHKQYEKLDSKKNRGEARILSTVHDMAAHSLNPDTFVALEEALKELARTRKIDWVPK